MIDGVRLITDLKADYARLVDAKDWLRLIECFTDDFEFEGQWSCTGSQAFVEHLRNQLAGATTEHRLGSPRIDVVTPDAGAATWPFTDVIDQRHQGTGIYRAGSGEYHERYRKSAVRWTISAMRIVRSHVECTVFAGGAAVETATVFSNEELREWLARSRAHLAELLDEPR